MLAQRPKWLAIGKQQIGAERNSLLQPPRKRFHSQSHSSLGRSRSPSTTKSGQSLTRNKSSIHLLNAELIQKIKATQDSQGQIFGDMTINILSQESKSGQSNASLKLISEALSLAQLTQDQIDSLHTDCNRQGPVQRSNNSIKWMDTAGKKFTHLNGTQQISFNQNSNQIIIANQIPQITTQVKIDKIIQFDSLTHQKLPQKMNHSHVPFYLRNQNYAEYLQESSDASVEQIPFGEELNESVVLETEELSMDVVKNDRSNLRISQNTHQEQSMIIQQMSFAESEKQKNANDLQPMRHYMQGYNDNILTQINIRPPISKQNPYQISHKKFIAKTKLQMHQLAEMTENLKITHQTILKEIKACQSKGISPLFFKNMGLHEDLLTAFRQILMKSLRTYSDNELHKQNQTYGKLLNVVIEKGLLGETHFRELDTAKKIGKIINQLEEKEKEVNILRESLISAEAECNKTSKVLLSKLQQVNSLKEELSKRQTSPRLSKQLSVTTVSPDIEKILREKQIHSNDMEKQIESLRQRNQLLMDEKQKLQQEVFTLEQRVIGVQMEIQERVRKGIQEIRPVVEDQMRSEFLKDEQARETTTNHQFFLQTIDTLSQQIKDLTEKCKYYENHINNQQKSSPKFNSNFKYDQQMQQMVQKRLTELDMQENTLLTIETQLNFKDKKLKQLQFRINREAASVQKRQHQCNIKQQEMQKYLQELNSRQEQLYAWQKQLIEQQKILIKKISDLHRQKSIFQNEKNSSQIMINQQYSMNHHHHSMREEGRNIINWGIENKNVVMNHVVPVGQNKRVVSHYGNNVYQYPSQYANSNTTKQTMSTMHNFNISQPRAHYTRPHSFHLPTQPANMQNYNDQPLGMENKIYRNLDRQNQQNMSQQYIRYNKLNQSDDIKESDHIDLDKSLRANGLESERSHTENNQNQNHFSRNRVGAQKLYLSSTYEKKSQIVEQILARRRNQNQMNNYRNERPDSKSPISNSRNHFNDFKKSDTRKCRSPIKNDLSYQSMKEITQRKLKERLEKKKMYEKPSKDMSEFYRPSKTLTSPSSNINGKKYPYDFSQQNFATSERQYTPKSYFKPIIPAAYNINQKLQKLKEQIKRQVRELE